LLCWRRTNAVVLDQMDVTDGQSGDHKSPRHHLRTHAHRTGASISLPNRTITPPSPHHFPPTDKHVSSECCDHQRKACTSKKNHFYFSLYYLVLSCLLTWDPSSRCMHGRWTLSSRLWNYMKWHLFFCLTRIFPPSYACEGIQTIILVSKRYHSWGEDIDGEMFRHLGILASHHDD
jgi:hypothetical protein